MSIQKAGKLIAGVGSTIVSTATLVDVADKRFCTDSEKSQWENKQSVTTSILATGGTLTIMTAGPIIKKTWDGTLAQWTTGRNALAIADDVLCTVIDDYVPTTVAVNYAATMYLLNS